METDELTQEAYDKLRERVQVLEELIFVEMKLTADRTDISACQKVEKIKAFIEQVILVWFLVWQTIGSDGFQWLFNGKHWSNDGMVMIHRYGHLRLSEGREDQGLH